MDMDAETLAMGGPVAIGGDGGEAATPATDAPVPPEAAVVHEDDGLLDLLMGGPAEGSDSATAGSTPSGPPPLPPPAESVPPAVGRADPTAPAVVSGSAVPAFGRAATQTLDFNLEDDVTESVAPPAASSSSKSDGRCYASASLVSTNSATAKDVALDVESVTIGRGDSCTVTVEDARVSGEQFCIRRCAAKGDATQWIFELEDRSRNGTFVNKKLVKGASLRLQERDLIEVLPASKVGRMEAISFLFQGVEPPSTPSGSVAPGVTSDEPPAKKAKTSADSSGSASDDIFEFAMCVICQEVMHRPTSCQPCNHSFCSACLGLWLRKPNGGRSVCPMCRKPVTAVARQHQMEKIIGGLLKMHPHKGRDEADLKVLDAQDPMSAANYDLARLRAGAGRGGGGLAAAALAGGMAGVPFGAGMPPGGLFAAAPPLPSDDDEYSEHEGSEDHSGSGSEDQGPPPGPPCFHCGTGPTRVLQTCARVNNETVSQALAGNVFEKQILEEWLASRSRAIGDAVQELLREPNPAGTAPTRVRLARTPPTETTAMPEGAWSDLNTCRGCGQGILRALVYSLRERIPDAELPERARGRPNCWYGGGCRTQRSRPEHARKLNHICVQTRFH